MGIPLGTRYLAIGVLSACLGAGLAYWAASTTGQPPGAAELPAPGGTPPAAMLDLPALKQLLAHAEPAERARLLASDEAFAAFVDQEARNQSVLISAYAQAADQSDAVQTLMRRAAQRVLVETYLNQLLRGQAATLEVTKAQAEAFYKEHPDQFQVPERVHLWQIFLPAKSSTERQNAQALGRQLLESLLSGKADFATLAARHSGHPQSRMNGGYMGLIPIADLKPEIRKAIEGRAAGKLIGPVESSEGYHVLERGATVAGSHLSYEEAAPQIFEYLRREALAKARADAVERMVEEHPVVYERDRLGAWRAELLKDSGAEASSPPAR